LAIRPSAIAGTWYPGSASALRRAVEGYLEACEVVSLPGPILALVSPHAGYAFSGATAAHAYAQVRGAAFTRVVLMGPLHRPIWGSRLGPFMTPAEGAYRTPLGDVPLDREFIAELDQRIALTPVHDDAEHSLEIELPFLQVVLGSFSLVPIMFGEHIGDRGARDRLEALAAALAELSDASTLLVASTDLSHLDNYADVLATDRRVLELVAAFDLERLARALASGEAQACGGSGLFAALRAAQRRGACGAQVLAYTSSGDVTGNKKPGIYTVGYLAAAVYA
jgi:hypothetical protein